MGLGAGGRRDRARALPAADNVFEVIGGDLGVAAAGGVDAFMAEVGGDAAEVLDLPVQLGAGVLSPGMEAAEGDARGLEGLLEVIAGGFGVREAEDVIGAGGALAALRGARAVLGAVGAQGAGEGAAHDDGALLAAFAVDADAAGGFIEVTPGQGQDLADAEPGVGGQQQQHLGEGVGRVEDAVDLVFGVGGAFFDAGGGVFGDAGVLEGLGVSGSGPGEGAVEGAGGGDALGDGGGGAALTGQAGVDVVLAGVPTRAQEADGLGVGPGQEVGDAAAVGGQGVGAGESTGLAAAADVGEGELDQGGRIPVPGGPDGAAAHLLVGEGGPGAGEGEAVAGVQGQGGAGGGGFRGGAIRHNWNYA